MNSTSNAGVIAQASEAKPSVIYCITSAINPKIPQLTMLSHANSTLFINSQSNRSSTASG